MDEEANNNKLPYVFGSSTPRRFSYMSHVPPELRIYDARLWCRESRLSREEERCSFRQLLKQARCQSASPSVTFQRHRKPRRHRAAITDDETSDDDSSYNYDYVFGSSTPRKWSHMVKLPPALRIYDVELFPHLRRAKRRSRTVESTTSASESLSLNSSMRNQSRDRSMKKPIIRKAKAALLSEADMSKSFSNSSSVLADNVLTLHQPAVQQTVLFFSEVASELASNNLDDQSPDNLKSQATSCLDFATIESVVLNDDAVQFTNNVQKSSALDKACLISNDGDRSRSTIRMRSLDSAQIIVPSVVEKKDEDKIDIASLSYQADNA